MKDDLDIMRQCRQLYAQGNALARRFHMCSDNVKVTLFRSYCSSLYTSQLWWKYRVNSIRKLYDGMVVFEKCSKEVLFLSSYHGLHCKMSRRF